jgi:major type 1 subunit fimbrin (pilin)
MNAVLCRRSALLALLGGLLCAGGSHAADLTLRFTGRFQPGTCAFAVANANLGSYQATSFTGSTTTGWQRVRITRSGCTSDITVVHFRANGLASTDNSQYFAARTAGGALSGIAIELSNLSSQRLVPNGTSLDWAGGTGTAIYDLQARFVQTRASVSAGQVSTPITLQFTYN